MSITPSVLDEVPDEVPEDIPAEPSKSSIADEVPEGQVGANQDEELDDNYDLDFSGLNHEERKADTEDFFAPAGGGLRKPSNITSGPVANTVNPKMITSHSAMANGLKLKNQNPPKGIGLKSHLDSLSSNKDSGFVAANRQ